MRYQVPVPDARIGDGSYHGHQPHPFSSKEEMQAHLVDKRYKGTEYEREPAYQAYIEVCLAMTSNNILGIAPEKSEIVWRPTDYQDPQNTLGGMTDVYRDMSEAHRDQSSQLYRTSAFERERVAQKINRSVPDSAVMSGAEKYNGSVQVIGDATEADGE